MIHALIRFRSFLVGYRARLVGGGVLTLASSLFALAQPWPLKVIVDSVLRRKPIAIPGLAFANGWNRMTLLYAAVGAYLAIVLVEAMFDYGGTYLMDSSGVRMVSDIREALFARLQRLSLRFHGTQRTGDLITRVMTDISRVQDMLIQWFSILIPNVVVLVGMMAVMFWIDWVFTLIALAVAPVLSLLAFRYKMRIRGSSKRARTLEGGLAARANEVLGAIPIVQGFTREQFEDDRFSRQSLEATAANLETARLQAQFSPLVDIVAGFGTAVVLLVGTRRVLTGELSLGLLLVFLSYLGSLYRPMRQLSKLAYTTSRGMASAERVLEILEEQPDVADEPRARTAGRLRGDVRFDDVAFGYESAQPVLHGIDLAVSAGEMIAVIGPTGAGKSTLVSLLPRFFDPQHGRVLIDETDARHFRLSSLRENIAIVPQEPILFEGTIFDNIAYGRRDATEAQVLQAAKDALVDDFVRLLPAGYDTIVGERGATVSGGERQRVSIARALVRQAPILILDEPTSSLDPSAEQMLMQALARLIEGRTTFVIAHRMSTIARASQVVVLDHGRIVERGTHEQLLRIDGGVYRSFLELQLAPPRLREAGERTSQRLPRRYRRALGGN